MQASMNSCTHRGAAALRVRPFTSSAALRKCTGRSLVARAEVKDRLLGSAVFLVPLFDSLKYGKFLFLQYPFFSAVLRPVLPLAELYFSNGFVSLIVFFALYLGVVNNQNVSRPVRYNAMQAILLDIILIVPSLLESTLRPPVGGPFLQIYITGYNTIFLFMFVAVSYGMVSTLAGRVPKIPLVSDAAGQQIR